MAMYIGRFAPSPTGPLHFGSLIAAVGSYLDARAQQGQWLVRMEDLDPPREPANAADEIMKMLDAFGFEWDGPVTYQSQRHAAYETVLTQLQNSKLVYPCNCSRKRIIKEGGDGLYGAIYPGTCRQPNNRHVNVTTSLRLLTNGSAIEFNDHIQGQYTQNLEKDIGDFNLRRRDGLYSYHLAVTVDDAAQGITHIVRGFDLLDSTPRQIYLQKLLNFSTPQYAHLPIATHADGDKLSKQTHAQALQIENATEHLCNALQFLGQAPPKSLHTADLKTIWAWAIEHWSLEQVPHKQKIIFEQP